MSALERCVHQGIDDGPHILFKEKWERCKNCAYDPENNKNCPDYSPTAYYVSDNNSNLISSKLQILENIRV
jgi:hypothetical protein